MIEYEESKTQLISDKRVKYDEGWKDPGGWHKNVITERRMKKAEMSRDVLSGKGLIDKIDSTLLKGTSDLKSKSFLRTDNGFPLFNWLCNELNSSFVK